MKAGTWDHPKFHALVEALACEPLKVGGLLEALWHYTAKFAPRGDIGKWSNAQIAAGAYWRGPQSADALIAALIAQRWIDASNGTERLLVHDWPEHATDAVHLQLARAGLRFADGQMPKLSRMNQRDRSAALARFQENGAVAGDPCARNAHAVRTDLDVPPDDDSTVEDQDVTEHAHSRARRAHAVRVPSPPIPSPPKEEDSPSRARARSPFWSLPPINQRYVERWAGRFGAGSSPPVPALLAALDAVREHNAEAVVWDRWDVYLDAALNPENPEFLTPARFQQRFALYDRAAAKARQGETHGRSESTAGSVGGESEWERERLALAARRQRRATPRATPKRA